MCSWGQIPLEARRFSWGTQRICHLTLCCLPKHLNPGEQGGYWRKQRTPSWELYGPACTADLGFWDGTPSRDAQLSAYMCLSRVKRAEDLCVSQFKSVRACCARYGERHKLPYANAPEKRAQHRQPQPEERKLFRPSAQPSQSYWPWKHLLPCNTSMEPD